MTTILDDIVEQTKSDLKKRMRRISFGDLGSFEGFEKQRIDFKKALNEDGVSIIAEVKKASPSKGVICHDFRPIDIALCYQHGGASAISVLTDEPFFQGHLEYLSAISKKVQLPLLRKDFIIDPYQIKEAKAYGADAVLIIVAIMDGSQLYELITATKEFGLNALVECYDQDDLDRIHFDEVDILGVNNRNLKTFEVDVHRGIAILKQAPQGTTLISESGISTGGDIALLRQEGIHAVLIGEFFMRQSNPRDAVAQLIEQGKEIYEKKVQNGYSN